MEFENLDEQIRSLMVQLSFDQMQKVTKVLERINIIGNKLPEKTKFAKVNQYLESEINHQVDGFVKDIYVLFKEVLMLNEAESEQQQKINNLTHKFERTSLSLDISQILHGKFKGITA